MRQLVVGVDCVAARVAVDISFRIVDGGDSDLAAHILKLQTLGNQLGGVDLDADRRFLLAADTHLRDAGNLADLLRQLRVGEIIDVDQGKRIGCHRQ